MTSMSAWTAAGVYVDCPGNDASGIPALWQRFNEQLGDFQDQDGKYGVNLPLPDGAEGYRYWAVVKLRDAGNVPAGMQTFSMRARQYAVFTYFDDPLRLPATYDYILTTRLPALKLKADPDWCEMEFYPEDWWDAESGRMRCDLLIAII